MIIKIFIVAVLGWFVFNFIGNQKIKNNRLSVAEFEKEISKENIQLIDVRTPSEYKSGHIKGAKNIDVLSAQFQEKIKGLDSSKPTYIYCRSGQRSQKALKIMLKNGFADVYDLKGGFLKWNARN